MSSFLILSFFVLLSGRRVRTAITKADGTSTGIWHVHYETALTCQEPPSLPAELRNYSPVNDTVFQDDTVAFVMAKAYAPPGNVAGNVLLDAIHVVLLPGDPLDDSYDEHLPDFPYPIVLGLGTVTSSVETLPDGRFSFPVSLSDYMRGNLKQSVLQ
jgi:hypothetical protein